MQTLTHAELACGLREALRSSLSEAGPFDPPPTVDLAVVAFPTNAPAVWANVLVHRGHPEGVVAHIGPHASAVQDIRYLVDPTDEQRRSIAWQPGADWTRLKGLQTLHGSGPLESIAPYPASLIKVMVAVGVGLLVDRGLTDWDEAWAWGGRTRAVRQWADGMITESRNDDTSALVALLHTRGLIDEPAPGRGWVEPRDVHPTGDPSAGARHSFGGLHDTFWAYGLPTLRLARTRPDGGWLNRDGSGVGHLQMTAWDTVRLLWLMLPAVMPDGPPPPWLAAGMRPLLKPKTAAQLWQLMDDQALHEVLSSTVAAGLPGWRAGIPSAVPARWVGPNGQVAAADRRWPGDIRPIQAQATVHFAHKTGTTENYASDAGWVRTCAPGGRRYLVALLSTLGSRHAPHQGLATDWCIPALGARIDAWLAQRLG
ncbi:MAG: hypothetical protein EBT96_07170 [Betaproteobacteria bacterium]|nr:hypothetical protein [Betaproteobacteria bacterium]